MMKKVGMTVRYNTFSYLIADGFKSFAKQKKMTSASIVIMVATMIMFGLFLLRSLKINKQLK